MHPLTRTHRQLLVIVGVLMAVTLIGLVLLWPRADALPDLGPPLEALVAAEITAVEVVPGEPDPVLLTSGDTATIDLRILDGPEAGSDVVVTVDPEGYPEFRVGDVVALDRVQRDDGPSEYFIRDFQRLPALLWLVALFVAAVLLIGRWHGLRALLGLALSLAIVIRFVVPGILVGHSPLLVALVGALAVLLVTLYLVHGVNEMTTVAILGTTAALAVTIGLALLFIDGAHITGFASDLAQHARRAIDGLDLRALVLAGLVIAALGVLDDVTVSQASTVFALHDTDRRLTFSALFARAMKVGRDHIASVVNTLVLVYAGASIVLLLLFYTGGLPTSEIVNMELVAVEILKTLVGSLGLITAVPLTTALAAAVAIRRPHDAPPLGGGHVYGEVAYAAIPLADDRAPVGAQPRSRWAQYLREEVRGSLAGDAGDGTAARADEAADNLTARADDAEDGHAARDDPPPS